MAKTKYLKQDDLFFPVEKGDETKVLSAGAYECEFTMDGRPYFSPIKLNSDNIVDIPNSVTDEVVKELKKFWSEGASKKFKEYGIIQKRGLMLEGIPGTGKTVSLTRASQIAVQEFGAVVLFNPPPQYTAKFVAMIKEIEPTKPILVIWEEFDSMLGRNESAMLSLLDGETQVENIMYLATTNYISRIPARIKNRPSRFARIINVGIPTKEARRLYLQAKLTAEDKEKHLEAMVDASDNFVMDQLKDLIVSVCVFEQSIPEAVHKIKQMNESGVGMDDAQEQMMSKELSGFNALTNLKQELSARAFEDREAASVFSIKAFDIPECPELD